MQAVGSFPRNHPGWTAAALAAVTAAAFARTAGFGYVSLDDPGYVLRPEVRAGLGWEGVRWAFTSFDQANWHPLTWLSYLADVSVLGASPGVFHATNVALHAAAAALLFLALRAMTGAAWRSLLVAALFALHPLHVESVAWISERKDVLSGLLFFAFLLAWSRYVRSRRATDYALAAALLALGLLAKPMLVTAPFVLLLLDVWPLGRAGLAGPAGAPGSARVPLARLVGEKLPLLGLAAASSLVTVLAQGHGGAFSEVVPLTERIENAVVAAGSYLWKAAWPHGLVVFYPHRAGQVSGPALAGSAVTLLAVSALAIAQLRRRPWIAVGWCWYLGMLVPVSGLVQVGGQAMADRYTYLPLVGVFVVAAWGAGALAEAAGRWRGATVAAIGAAVLALAVATVVQVSHWRDDASLFGHAAELTEGNWLAHDMLGNVAYAAGRRDEAARQFVAAIRANPGYAVAHFHLGLLLSEAGDQVGAVNAYRTAIRLEPGNPIFHNNLGNALYLLGLREEAAAEYREALRLDPGYRLAAENLRAAGGP
jgi:tetratricopeptide (TPR) repeat protein